MPTSSEVYFNRQYLNAHISGIISNTFFEAPDIPFLVTISKNDGIAEGFEYSESILNGNQIEFGKCIVPEVKLIIRKNINVSIVGAFAILRLNYSTSNGSGYDELGGFIVKSDSVNTSANEHTISFVGLMSKYLNDDVAAWYNSVLPNALSSMTLAQFRASLASHWSLNEESQTFNNDNIIVKRTIDPKTLSGKTVLNAIGQLLGAFPSINASGHIEYLTLPTNVGSIADSEFYGCYNPEKQRQAFTLKNTPVKAITRVQIRNEEGEVGATYGVAGNDYIITNNFICYGMNASTLQTVAQNVLENVENRAFVAYADADVVGVPTMHVCDPIWFKTKDVSGNDISVKSYVLQRNLRGLSAMYDRLDADVAETRNEKINSIQSQFTQLNGKTLKIQADVDAVRIDMSNKVSDTTFNSFTQQTAQALSGKVSSTGGSSSSGKSFGYEMTDQHLQLIVNNETNPPIFECNKDGLYISGEQVTTVDGDNEKSIRHAHNAWQLRSARSSIDHTRSFMYMTVNGRLIVKQGGEYQDVLPSEESATNIDSQCSIGAPTYPWGNGYFLKINGGTPLTVENFSTYFENGDLGQY